MKNEVNINIQQGRYLIDIANKLILPKSASNNDGKDDGYYSKRYELLKEVEIKDYKQFVKTSVRLLN